MCLKQLKLITRCKPNDLYNIFFLANQIVYFKFLVTRRYLEYIRLGKKLQIWRVKKRVYFAAKDYVSDLAKIDVLSR